MKKEENQIIKIKTKASLSRNQKMFNSRSKKLQKLKDDFETLKKQIDEVKSKYHASIVPVQEKLVEVKVAIVKVFDKAYEKKFFRNKEKEKLSCLIVENTLELINDAGREELIPIYEKYSETSYAEEKEVMDELGKSFMGDMIKNMTGVDIDLDDIDFDNPNDMESIAKKVADSMEENERIEQEKNSKRKKTKAQRNKEERIKEEAKKISKSSKEIYNQLIKNYHPDLEQDAEKREEKTALMQEITQAYQNDDFFSLLNFQIQLRQSDEFLAELTEENLKYYNKILLEQIRELEHTISAIKNPMMSELSQYLNTRGKQTSVQLIEQEKQELENQLEGLERDCKRFENNKELRAFLKTVDIEEEDDMPFFPMFDLDFDDDDDEWDD